MVKGRWFCIHQHQIRNARLYRVSGSLSSLFRRSAIGKIVDLGKHGAGWRYLGDSTIVGGTTTQRERDISGK